MNMQKRVQHFVRWCERNYDVIDYMCWSDVFQLYEIFKHHSPDYSIKRCVELNEGCALNDLYNQFCEKHGNFNKYIDGQWKLTQTKEENGNEGTQNS